MKHYHSGASKRNTSCSLEAGEDGGESEGMEGKKKKEAVEMPRGGALSTP